MSKRSPISASMSAPSKRGGWSGSSLMPRVSRLRAWRQLCRCHGRCGRRHRRRQCACRRNEQDRFAPAGFDRRRCRRQYGTRVTGRNLTVGHECQSPATIGRKAGLDAEPPNSSLGRWILFVSQRTATRLGPCGSGFMLSRNRATSTRNIADTTAKTRSWHRYSLSASFWPFGAAKPRALSSSTMLGHQARSR